MKFNAVHLVGVGGTGSILLEPLILLFTYHRNGTTNINIWDKDNYESNNNVRQLFDPQYIGMNKAEAAVLRYQSICPSLVAHPEFLTDSTLYCNLKAFPMLDSQLIILTVDNDPTRRAIVSLLENYNSNLDFALVLPGNEFYTATCLVYPRVGGVYKMPSPLETSTNIANPEGALPGSCGYKAVSSPQLLGSNFMSACIAFNYVYKLLEDEPMPFRVNYDGASMTVLPEGRFIECT